ncbi:hypothetical protein BaRGS_00031260, partial [Batillaria attramentaria]
MPAGPVAVVTGANAGIGLAVCEQLLASHPDLTLCLACRNEKRAEEARDHLQALNPGRKIDVVLVDTSNVKSVVRAAKVFKEMYDHIDYLYLNAGIMQAGGVRWGRIISGIFSSQCVHVLTTGEGLIVQQNGKTDEGLMRVFATNLFGHYVLLVWTSSSNAQHRNFSFDDLQHEKGEEPYSSSKYATDMLSVALNEKLNKQGIYSHCTCPGLVMTRLTDGILPWWFWLLVLPFILLMRIFVPSMTNSPSKGATALVWLSHQKPETLDPRMKYRSLCSVTGQPYVGSEKMQVDMDESLKLLEVLESMRLELTQ